MGIWDSIKQRFQRRGRGSDNGLRSYAGAAHGRLTADWIVGAVGPNAALRGSLSALRNRCRDLERNNDYVRGFLGALQTNVVGASGIRLQMRVRNDDGSPDVDANRRIEEAWAEWGRHGICTVDGRMSWADVQRLFIRSVARDGEIIVRLVRGAAAGNDFGFALQLLEADHLDETDDRDLSGNRRVRMGVEIDGWGRPTALHLWRSHPGDMISSRDGERKIRLPMRDAVHAYLMERPGQLRGIPWLSSAIMRLHQLGKYEEAELVAARVASSKMGFFEPDPDADHQLIGQRHDGELLMEAAPGQFEMLPPGYRFQPWDPQHPNNAFEAFTRAMLRGVSASLGCSYATLSADLAQTNYSSLRQGALSERDMWRLLQAWMIEAFLRPVFMAWLGMAMTTGALALPMSKWRKFAQPTFQPRGWDWVDPLKEVNAAIAEIEMGLNTHSNVVASKGRDLADLMVQRQAEDRLAAAHGVDLPRVRPKASSMQKEQTDANAE